MSARRCLVCGAYGAIALGIRARYENTNAVWAPNLDAYLCTDHAETGCEIVVNYRSTNDGRVRVQTLDERDRRVASIVLVIGQGGRTEKPGQEALL